MKQSPSNLKFKKYHKISDSFLFLTERKKFFPTHGRFALQSLEAGKITYRHIEAGRRSIRRTTKKQGRIWIKLFPYVSVTKKASGLRMGKGKGNHSLWICPVKKGQILYELSGLPRLVSEQALLKAGSKMPLKTCIVNLIY